MDDASHSQRRVPKIGEGAADAEAVADAADIPMPPSRALQEELAAQARPKDRQDFGTLPRNLMEAVLLVQEMEREGKRVGVNREALMDFLRQQPGDVVTGQMLEAMAILMASIPERRKEGKGLSRFPFLHWIRNKGAYLKAKLTYLFKGKKRVPKGL
jgi:hypothetical protein